MNGVAPHLQEEGKEGESGLQRALSTPISEMLKNVATGYLYQSNGNNSNRARNRNSSGTPKKGDGQEWRRMPLNVVMKILSIHEHALELQK